MRMHQFAFAAIIGCTFVTSAVAAPTGFGLSTRVTIAQKATWVCDPSHCTFQPGRGTQMEPRAGWTNPNSPCGQIRAACLSAGFVQGGSSSGVGLQFDCIHPIIEGRPQRPRAGLPLPPINPQIVAACRAILAQSGGPPVGPGGQPRGPMPRPGYGSPPPDGGPPPGNPPPGAEPPHGAEGQPGSEPPPPGNGPAPGNPPPPDNQ